MAGFALLVIAHLAFAAKGALPGRSGPSATFREQLRSTTGSKWLAHRIVEIELARQLDIVFEPERHSAPHDGGQLGYRESSLREIPDREAPVVASADRGGAIVADLYGTRREAMYGYLQE